MREEDSVNEASEETIRRDLDAYLDQVKQRIMDGLCAFRNGLDAEFCPKPIMDGGGILCEQHNAEAMRWAQYTGRL